MLRQLHETIRRHRLFRKGNHVLVGVSGGADSVALLHALQSLKEKLGLRLTVAHLNHGIRGRAADRDEEFVRLLAARLGTPFVGERVRTRVLARERGVSLEMAAREARYAFFARALRTSGASVLATAHHADDQAETVLLRLLRGAGSQGLGGMAYCSTRDGMTIVRPMLDVTHADAVRFLKGHRRRWREDASNSDTDMLRNRVRIELLPLLEKKFNPQVRRALQRTAEVLREEGEWMDALSRAALTRCTARTARGSLDAKALRKQPLALRRRVVIQWLLLNGIEAEAVDFDAVERVLALAAGTEGSAFVPVSGAVRVVRRYDSLSVDRRTARSATFAVSLKIPGVTALPDCGLAVVAKRTRGFARSIGEAYIARAAVGKSRLVMRNWRAGDRIRPLGMDGTRKVQDVFGDLKVPRDERGRVPILVCRGEVVWVPGYRVARGWDVKGPGSPSIHLVLAPR